MLHQTGNSVLDLLPSSELRVLKAELRSLPLHIGDTVAFQDQPIDRVFFPEKGLIAVEHWSTTAEAVTLELIGAGGILGIEVLLDVPPLAIGRAFVAVPGQAQYLPAARLRALSPLLPELRHYIAVAARARMLEMSQTALCHARHSLESRCARWLLMLHDRLGTDEIPVTHDFLARALGVRRAGVTCALGGFQETGLISQARAQLHILNREGLAAASCGCHAELEHRLAALWAAPRTPLERVPVRPANIRLAIHAALPDENATADTLRRAAIVQVCRDMIRRCSAVLPQ